MRQAGRGDGDPGLPRLLAPAAGVWRALCARLSAELGEPLQAPPLANSSPHWSAASLPTAPQRSRRRLRFYCSAHEILMQERLAGGGAAPGLGGGGGDALPSTRLALRGFGAAKHGVRIFPAPHKGAAARLSLGILACSATIATLASGEARDGRRPGRGPGIQARSSARSQKRTPSRAPQPRTAPMLSWQSWGVAPGQLC